MAALSSDISDPADIAATIANADPADMAAALEIVAQAVDPGISLMYICNSVSSSEAEVLFQVSKLLVKDLH